jgi:hypothetical protein
MYEQIIRRTSVDAGASIFGTVKGFRGKVRT